MLRISLLVISAAMFAWGSPYWLGMGQPTTDLTDTATVNDVLAGYPCGPLPALGAELTDKRVRLENIEVDVTQAVCGAASCIWRYVPVKGTQDRLYLEIWDNRFPPAGPTTAIGFQLHNPATRLPPELAMRAAGEEFFLVSYQGGDPVLARRHDEKPFFKLATIALGLAALLQLAVMLRGFEAQQHLVKAAATASVDEGPCTICGHTGPRIGVYFEAEKWRPACFVEKLVNP